VPRAVLDTNVLVSALISPGGGSAQLLPELLASPLLLAELRDVLGRDKFRRYVSAAEADAYVDLIRSEGVLLGDPEPAPEPFGADPHDEFFIDLAREARADALVTGDAHLLKLRGIIPAMTPAEFLEMLTGR
jgi:putative PIN family toxin of toxin-antitoxin system